MVYRMSKRAVPRIVTIRHERHHCCFSQNYSRPWDAEPPITQGMPIAT